MIRSPAGERQVSHLPVPFFFHSKKTVERDETATALKRLAEGGFGIDLLAAGVEGRIADLDVRQPIRDEAPAHHLETARALAPVGGHAF